MADPGKIKASGETRLWRRGLLGLGAVVLLGAAASAAPPAKPGVRAKNVEIVAGDPDTAKVFKVQANGDILHLKSGLRCPGSFPHVDFWHADLFPAQALGDDVGCDYGRSGPDGTWVSKLTIFATRADSASLDVVFSSLKAEVAKEGPDAQYKGEAIKAGPGPLSLGEYRSAEFVGTLDDGRPYASDLIVAIRNGWILEIRATFATRTADGEAVASAADDVAGPSLAFLKVVNTVGQSSL